jgi:formylglycine-generating enzyme required for sulfatase activity
MSSNNRHITLPLDPLLELLEAAGFDASPATRVRAWRVLSGIGRDAALRDPADLKFLLAPVFARNAEEQQRFYEVFDRYVRQIKQPLPSEPPPSGLREKIRTISIGARRRAAAVAAAVLAVLLVLAWAGYTRRDLLRLDPLPTPEFEMGRAVAGDTVVCRNRTEAAGIRQDALRYTWTLFRIAGSDTTVAQQGGGDTAWQFVAPAPRPGETWAVDLTLAFRDGRPGIVRLPGSEYASVLDLARTSEYRVAYSTGRTQRLEVSCSSPPAIPRLRIPSGKLRPGERLTVRPAERARRGTVYAWSLAGQPDIAARKLQFRPERPGLYFIRLTVSDTAQAGTCVADTSFSLQVGETIVRLPQQPLLYDRTPPALVFGWGLWLLIALLAAAAGWYWVRWFRRKPLPPRDAPEAAAPGAPSAGGDKPPYYIPFRDPAKSLRTARAQFRLADALRRRQETDELVLDLPATLRATLDRGGFPAFRYRPRTRPSEYLFLVPEQIPGRHLARLFRHLAETLRGQDVQIDLVWCDAGLRHFRAPGLPAGLHADALRRYFPHHRLILLGDGHALLDAEAPRLRPDAQAALNGWPHRLLLSARPPADWDWREEALYRHLGLFPADLRGLLDTARFVENGLETDDLPANFSDWKALQLALRPADPPLEYRSWRTLDAYRAVLEPLGSDLYRWFLALAVHPSPSWEITVAIARRLGIAPTHDRLLALSRLPALRDGQLHPGLRLQMLRALDQFPGVEAEARRAVLDELEAVRHLTEGSHVAEETGLYVAVQAFLLAPDAAAHRAAIAGLLRAGLLSRPMEQELNRFVEKELANPENEPDAAWRQKMAGRPAGIREWLEAVAPEPAAAQQPVRPFFTADFRRAAACTAAALLLGLLGWLACRPDSLVQQALVRDTHTPGRDELRHFVLLKENLQADSALIYNNLGVLTGELHTQTGQSMPLDSLQTAIFQLRQNLTRLAGYNAQVREIYRQLDTVNARESLRAAAPAAYPAQDALFRYAQNLKPDYPRARQNQARNAANHAAALLEQYRSRPDSLRLAAGRFAAAAELAGDRFPAERRFALHGAGVALYYAGSRDSAITLYDTLLAAGYFDTLRLRPNLESLLFGNGVCYTVTARKTPLPFLQRPTDAREQAAADSGPGNRLPAAIPAGQTVTVLDSTRTAWRIRFQGRVGYVPRLVRNEPTLLPCDAPPKPDPQSVIAAIEAGMVRVEGGSFRMGCTEEQGEDCWDWEKPPHEVQLSDFLIGRTEVTVGQFRVFIEETNYRTDADKEGTSDIWTGDSWETKKGVNWRCNVSGRRRPEQEMDHPVLHVSWNDAVAFCAWLSQRTGTNYRLPTEAEWEYAARGGRRTEAQTKYAGSAEPGSVAWYRENAGGKTHPVGRKGANALGLYDMSGNVWEWCADWYGDYADTGAPQLNPRGPEEGDRRVNRGGSWGFNAGNCRVSDRNRNAPDDRLNYLGFRLAASPSR